MELSEIREKKQELEIKISRLVEEFWFDTNVIPRIAVNTEEYSKADGTKLKIMNVKVNCFLEV